MIKRIFVGFIIFLIISYVYATVFYPIIYLPGYDAIINNRVDVYKIDKGLNINKTKPYMIPSFALDKKESIDFAQQKVTISTKVGDYKIAPDVVMSFDQYFANMQNKVFRQSLINTMNTDTQQTQATASGLFSEFSLELPNIAIPRSVQKVLGNKAGRLNLDGTQKLTVQVSSTKRKQVPIYETARKSTFDIKMEQETNLRLTGTIGEKIAVNMKYNSKQDEQLFDPNNLNIKYTGTEDEVIQSIEAGNIGLSLSGSRYISYSTSSQGLFGVTSKMKFGDLDLTVIASKEEGQKNTQSYVGKSQADSTIFRSKDYVPRTMYYIDDPFTLYQIYGQDDQGDLVPASWIGNAIKTDITGAWKINDANLLPANGTVRLFLDDANSSNNVTSVVGDTIFFSSTDFYVPYYDELIEGTDFVTDYSSGIIQLLKGIDRLATLGIRYTRKDGTKIPANSDVQNDILHAKAIRRRNQEYNPDDPNNVWHYQMRNVYNLNKNNIKSDGFSLDVYTLNVDNTRNYSVPDSVSVPTLTTYNRYLRLDSSGDDIINGDDATVNLTAGLIIFPFLEPFQALGDGIIYEDEGESINYQDISLYMAVKGKIGRDAIDLSQGGLLKGSVRVRVNGNAQKENTDYLVDYDLGRITFLTAAGKDPDAKIEVDYEYRSMFDVAKKSLAGVRADWNITDNTKLGATLIYRSENVSDKRPKIGNENIEMLMADVDGSITVKPKFMTRWLDALPLINTNAESRIALSGELALTVPNIYGDPSGKKNYAYVDDMESIVDQYPLGVTFSTWVQASKPYITSLAKGRTNWYNPKNIRREQIEEGLTDEREKKETVSVLAVKIFPNSINMPGSTIWNWGGVMKYMGNQLDFSTKKYIELLVKIDHKTTEIEPNVTLRIDLGDISEDFYTDFGGLDFLNTEDKNNDGVLTLDEDLGLDGRLHETPGADPNDLASETQDQYGDYPQINGTEGNRGVPDTEDLDGNGVLSKLNKYYSYTISLNSELYCDNTNHDGWKLYRIPLSNPNAYEIVNSAPGTSPPTLKKISYSRIIVESDTEAKVLIADISVVGNKWQDFFVRNSNNSIVSDAELNAYGTTFLSGIANNKKNTTHYTPPPGTVYKDGTSDSSESSLTLEVKKLQPGKQVLLRQRLLDPYNLLSYDKFKFWVYPEAEVDATIKPAFLDIVFRIGADSLNYYEIRQKTPVNTWANMMDRTLWHDYIYQLQTITALKEITPGALEGESGTDETMYSFKGNPTLTNVREIYFGIYNRDSNTGQVAPFNGTVYFNDLIVADPFEDMGWAQRLTLNTAFADVATLDVDYEQKSENFNTVIQRGRQNIFTQTTTFNITNKYFLNKLFPNSWALDIPISLYRNYSLGIPRYRANSDLLRENMTNLDEKEKEKTENLLYASDFGFSQKTAPKNKFLAYTLYRTSISGRVEQAYRYTSTTTDSILTWRGTWNYNLSFSTDKTSFPLYKSYRIGFFPTTLNNSFSINTTEPSSWNWEKIGEEYIWNPRAQTIPTKQFTSDNNINMNLTSDIGASLRLNTKRDLIQQSYFKDINIGKETEYVQDLGLTYNPTLFSRIYNFSTTGSSKFSDYQKKYTQNSVDGLVDYYQRDGNTNRTVRTTFTLMNSTLLASWATKLATSHRASIKPKPNTSTGAPEKPSSNKIDEAPKPDYKEQNPDFEPQGDNKPDFESDDKKPELDTHDETAISEEQKKEMDQKAEYDRKYAESLVENKGDEQKPEEGKPSDENKPDDGKPEGNRPPKTPGYLPAQTLALLSKVKNINTAYQNIYTMNYLRKDDRPPIAFQLGVPHSVEADYLDSKSDDNTITVSSGIIFSRNLDSTINYSYGITRRYSSASNQNIDNTFPDITLSLMDFEKWLGLQKYLSSSRVNTGFQYKVSQNGSIDWDKPKQETKSMSLNPLLGLTTNLMNTVTANVSVTMSQSENITDMETFKIRKTTDAMAFNGSFSYSYRAGKGFTIPFTSKKIHIKNEMTSSLAFQYENNFDKTFGKDSNVVDRDYSRFSITPGATYQFDQNIKGGLTSSYEITSDRKREDGTSKFNLGMWVEVTL